MICDPLDYIPKNMKDMMHEVGEMREENSFAMQQAIVHSKEKELAKSRLRYGFYLFIFYLFTY